MTNSEKLTTGEILLYQTKGGGTRFDVLFDKGKVWLTEAHLARLFQVSERRIATHIKDIFATRELSEKKTVKEFPQTAEDGQVSMVKNYNLPMVFSIGFYVKSHRGKQFRNWAKKNL